MSVATEAIPRRTRRAAMPRHIAPMLALLAERLPARQADYAFEFKWDGVRALLFFDGQRLRIESRNLLDVTAHYPEFQALAPQFRGRRLILDGELVALNERGQPDFPLLTRRMHVQAPSPALLARVPVTYMVFDILYLDGKLLFELPYLERRALLARVPLSGPALVPPFAPGAGDELLQAARDLALEGVVAKKLASPYEPGRRGPAWLKIKNIHTTELVVGGWVPERSQRGRGRVGALLLGYYADGVLRYAGRVGTGFDAAEHEHLTARLQHLASSSSPFADAVPRKDVLFVKPRLVAQIEYRRWPEGGSIQQAAYKGLRTDKAPEEVTGGLQPEFGVQPLG